MAPNVASQQITKMRVEINFYELMQTIETIMSKDVEIEDMSASKQVCGLPGKDYARALKFCKVQCLKLLEVIFDKFGNLSKTFVAQKLPAILQ